uniref:Uncharacterized protein n=1 Tax=Arundo donax TaxID=35708 RepID=A0A0A9AHW8_ARUDO
MCTRTYSGVVVYTWRFFLSVPCVTLACCSHASFKFNLFEYSG